jgi:ribosomal protein L14E/L6E/L27E
MMQLDPSVPELFAKVRRPYEDTLRVLGVKDVDSYLPTIEEAAKIMQAKSQQPPSPEQLEITSRTDLNKAKTDETVAKTLFTQKKAEDVDTDNMFEALAAKRGKLTAVEID